jgi:hypothetical protein
MMEKKPEDGLLRLRHVVGPYRITVIIIILYIAIIIKCFVQGNYTCNFSTSYSATGWKQYRKGTSFFITEALKSVPT